jgi:SecD/SecF fusion protein
LALGALAGFLYTRFSYKLGLDVKGGVRFTYQVKPAASLNGKQRPIEDVLDKTKTILENRISSVTGVAEGTVIIKGTDQIVVEIPGYADIEKAREQIGTSASLKGYWAKNVQTAKVAFRTYRELNRDDSSSNPSVDFENTITHQTLKYGDPEYQKMIDGWELLVTGDQLTNAQAQPLGNGTYQPEISFTSEGGDALRKWSERYRGKGEQVAFVLDGHVLQIAPVKENATLGEQIVVEGQFKPSYVTGLCSLLNAGALPVDLTLLSSEKVDPTIGQSALSQMVKAGLIAFGVISLFLIVYYAFPGVVAFFALMLYVLFTLTVLKMMGATFSLAAIAGFVLSVGMAVDANILVFERFKEEIKRGKPLHNALSLGFSRALPAIIDSNACSILTSLMLAALGNGPVRGFATTLIIGVLISLFTAVTVTRSLLFFLTDSGIGNDPKMYGINRNWFGEHLESQADSKPLNITGQWRTWFTITAVFVVASFVFIGLGGLKTNVEFTGGFEAVYARTDSMPSASDIERNLTKNGIKGSSVKFGTDDKGHRLAYVTVPGAQFKDKTPEERNAQVAQIAGLPANTQPLSFSEVGPVIQRETVQNAIVGVLGSFALIIIYLGFRFGLALGNFGNGLRFGASAIAAGVKDIWVILGVAAAVGLAFGWEVSSLFITAMLTVIGFSVHDKIVIFDRIRENLRHPKPDETFDHLVDRSITASFARSINTAAAVVVTLAILIVFGTSAPDLKFFLTAMLAGIAWGTYSSIYTAAPVLALWEKAIEKRKGEGATLLGMARAEAAKNRIIRPVAVPVAPTGEAPKPEAGDATAKRSYGQVRRRASAVSRSQSEVDE